MPLIHKLQGYLSERRKRKNMATLIHIAWLVLLVIQPAFSSAQPFMANISGRNTIRLSGEWQIIADWYDRGEQRKIFLDEPPKNKNSFNEYCFSDQTLTVPGDWNSQRPDLKYYEGVVWYKK